MSELYQVGVEWDMAPTATEQQAIALFSKHTGWQFAERVDDGVWMAAPPQGVELQEGRAFDLTLDIDGDDGDEGGTIQLHLEWP